MAQMSEDELRAVVTSEIDLCRRYLESEVSRKRSVAYHYYAGKEYGNEVEGRSKVVSQDVQQQIDAAVPALIKMFVSSDRAVQLAPRNAEDVQGAEQATDVCNYVFYNQNPGFQLVHDCIKDGLLQITGMWKWWWQHDEKVNKETYMGLSEEQFTMLLNDPEVDVIAHSEGPLQMPSGPVVVHNVTVARKKTVGQIRVSVIPPEEQLISPRALNNNVDDAPFIGHATLKTRSELIEMGYDADLLATIPSGDDIMGIAREKVEREARSLAVYGPMRVDSIDESTQRYRYYECYMRVDFDGDGVAELRRLCVIQNRVLHNEEVDHIPIAYWTPTTMPHEPIGVSMAEQVADLQFTKSMLWRQMLDNIYLANSPRISVVEGQVNIDDVLNNVPGGLIRMAQPGMVQPVTTPFIAQHTFPMLEYLDGEAEARTGVSRLFQGVDPDSLNKTATGVNALMNAAQARLDLIARNFAENAMKPLFKGILYLLAKHQDQALTIRLRNQFVPVDPRAWTTEYDMTVNVGLGTGTKDQQLQQLMSLGQDIFGVMQTPYGQQLIDAKKIHNFIAKKAELMGFKDPSIFVNDPTNMPPPQPPGPPPEVQVAQIEQQTAMQKAQLEMQNDAQKASLDAEVEKYKADTASETDIQVAKMKEVFALKEKMLAAGIPVDIPELFPPKVDEGAEALKMVAQAMHGLKEALTTPKRIVRGPDGRAQGIAHIEGQEAEIDPNLPPAQVVAQAAGSIAQSLKRPKRIIRGPDGRAEGVA